MLFLENLLGNISINIDEFYLIMLTRDSYGYICYVVGICYLSSNLYLLSTIEYNLIMRMGSIVPNLSNSACVSLIACISTLYSASLTLDQGYGIDWSDTFLRLANTLRTVCLSWAFLA